MMGPLITRTLVAIGGTLDKKKREAFLRTIAAFLIINNKQDPSVADHAKKLAMELLEEDKNRARAETDQLVASNEEKRANIKTKRLEAEAKVIKARGEALAKVFKSIHEVNRSGGSMNASMLEINSLLYSGSQEFPNDPLIARALSNAEESEP